MTNGTLRLGAGKESAFNAKDTFFLRGGALLANGSADCLAVAEMAYFVESCIKKIQVAVDIVEGSLVKEQQSMIFEAFEFLVSLHLLLEVIRHKLALLAMASKLVRANEGLLALLRIERAFE